MSLSGVLTLVFFPTIFITSLVSSSAFSALSTSRRMPPALVHLVVFILTSIAKRLMDLTTFFITSDRDPPTAGRSMETAAVFGVLSRSNFSLSNVCPRWLLNRLLLFLLFLLP